LLKIALGFGRGNESAASLGLGSPVCVVEPPAGRFDDPRSGLLAIFKKLDLALSGKSAGKPGFHWLLEARVLYGPAGIFQQPW
jgi:hypothetical protein